jgi:hypothetical protein
MDAHPQRLDAEYVLPLRWPARADLADLTGYLATLSESVDVTVVDGSDGDEFDRHAAAWGRWARHVRPDPWPGRNRKVAAVVTGVRWARHEAVIIADDDVRYQPWQLTAVTERLAGADLVRPQNVFAPAPWHARWDTARSLINRAVGQDFPGTFAVRRSTFLSMGGYDGDVLFENLQLMRTVRAAGGEVRNAPDLYVHRHPPAVGWFARQRVRQAYDDFAQPGRLLAEAALLPVTVVIVVRRPRMLPLLAAAGIGLAEIGRRRYGGARVWPATAALWAPLWLAERAVCVWLAIGARMRGGVRYHGERVRHAGRAVSATPAVPASRTGGDRSVAPPNLWDGRSADVGDTVEAVTEP